MWQAMCIGREKVIATWTATVVLSAALLLATDRGLAQDVEAKPSPRFGAGADAGCRTNPKRVSRLRISEPGVYENILVDGEWADGTLVKITADKVTLRNCEIRHGRHNAITVSGKDIVIESCRIHHLLAGTFDDQKDAHGITGDPDGLTIRNCEIGMVSGDALQFDPGRRPWDRVLVENCTLWTGPLENDVPGFRRGQRPGENAVDTKQRVSNPRSRMTIRHCLLYGWNQPGQIANMAALNLKNHVQVRVEQSLFHDNEIAFRVRGGSGQYGGAAVAISDCVVYDGDVAVRAEDGISPLRIRRIGIAPDVNRSMVTAGGRPGTNFEMTGEFRPPPFEQALESGMNQQK